MAFIDVKKRAKENSLKECTQSRIYLQAFDAFNEDESIVEEEGESVEKSESSIFSDTSAMSSLSSTSLEESLETGEVGNV